MKNKKILMYTLLSIITLVSLICNNTSTVDAASEKIEFYLVNSMTQNRSDSSEKYQEDITSFGGYIQLELYAKSLTGSTENFSAFIANIETENKGISIDSFTSSETVLNPFKKYTNFGPIVVLKQENRIELTVSLDYMTETGDSKFDVGPEPVKIGDILLIDNQTDNIRDFNIKMSISQIDYRDQGVKKYYESGEVSIGSYTVGNPQTGPDLSINPVVTYGTNNTNAHISNSGNNYTIKKTSSTNFKFNDTQNMYLELGVAPDTEVSVTKNSIPIDQTSGKYKIGPLTSDETFIVTVGDTNNLVTYNLTFKVDSPSTEALLSSLTATNGSFSETFKSNTFKYNLTLPFNTTTTTFNYQALANDLNVTTVGIKETYNSGDKVEITVSAPHDSEITNTYEITILFEQPSSNSDLNKIDVTYSGNQQTLFEDNLNLIIPANIDRFSFSVLSADSKASVVVKIGSNIITKTTDLFISTGDEITYTIEITAENGVDQQSYQLVVTREKSSNNELTAINIIDGGNTYTISPQESQTYYLINSSGAFNINPVLADSNAKIVSIIRSSTGIDIQLMADLRVEHISLGEEFIIKVAAENGNTKDYRIIISKKSNEREIVEYYVRNDLEELAYYGEEGYPYEIIYNNKADNIYSLTLPYKATNRIELFIKTSEKSSIDISTKSPSNLNINKISNNTLDVVHIFSGTTTEKISFRIIVSAENGEQTVYLFEITREGADTEKRLDVFELDGNPVLNFNNSATGGTYETLYIRPNTLTTNEHLLTLNVSPKSQESNIRITINDENQGIEKGNRALSYKITSRGKLYSILIEVFSESSPDTNPAVYKIDVMFASNDVELLNIGLEGLVINYDNSSTEHEAVYRANALFSNRTTKILFDIKQGANYTISSDAKATWNLNVYENIKTVTVTSEDKQVVKTYKFIIDKAEGRSEKDLKTLQLYVNNELIYDFPLTKGITRYSYRIDDIHQNFTLKASIDANIGATLNKSGNQYQRDYPESIASGDTKIITISVYDENGVEKAYFIEILRANNNANFESITIGGTTYSKTLFEGNSEVTGGVLKLPNVLYATSYLDFFVNGLDSKAKVVYPQLTKVEDGKWNLLENLNTIVFQVEAQDKTRSLEYRVEVFRESAKTNNLVQEIKLTYLNREGTEVNKVYTNLFAGEAINEIVGKGISNVTVTVKLLKADRSTIEGFSLISSDELFNIYQRTYTTTLISVNVVAENSDINTHLINISKLNNNNIIENIEIIGIENDYTIDFVGNYTISVRQATEPFIIRITKEDAFAKLIINNTQIVNQDEFYYELLIDPAKLNEGSNNYNFKLQSEYNFTNKILEYGKDYTIVISKAAIETENYLTNLEVNLSEDDLANYLDDFAYNKHIFNEIKLNSNQQRVIIKAYTKVSDYSTVLINNKKVSTIIEDGIITWKDAVLLDGKEVNIKITVIAEDGISTNEYIVPINRKSNENTIQRVVVSINGNSETYVDFNKPIILSEVSHSTSEIQIEILRSDKFAAVYVDGFLKPNQNATNEYSFTYNLANPNDQTLNKISIHLVSEYGTIGNVVNFEISRKKADNVTELKELEIFNEGVNLFGENTFSPNLNEYKFIIPRENSNQIFVTANALSELANVSLTFGGIKTNEISNYSLILQTGINAANIINITVTAESGSTYTYVIYIYYANNNYELGQMLVSDNLGLGNYLDVNFDSNNNYNETVAWDFGEFVSFDISLVDDYASFEVIRFSDGQKLNVNNISLNEGLNRFQIIVTSNYGLVLNPNFKVNGITKTTKTYNVAITKEKANRDTTLYDLKVINVASNSALAFNRSFDPFDTNNKNYEINLKNEISEIRIELMKKDHQVVEYDTNIISLDYVDGKITKFITIRVIAEGSEDNYRIRITKGEDLSNNTAISDVISLKGPNNTYYYNFNNNNEENPLVITSSDNYLRVLQTNLSDSNATLENDVIENIIPGIISKLTFVVIAEDAITKQTYELFVRREGLSDDNTLKTLTISANGIEYYTNGLDDVEEEINVNIPRNQNVVMISTSINDLKATGLQINDKKINGSYVENSLVNVVTGRLNIITITVVAENGDIKVYRINVNLRDTDATVGLEFQLEDNTKLIPEILEEDSNTIIYNLGKLNYNEKTLNIMVNKNGNNYVVIDGYGTKQLSIGLNEFIITSTSEDQLTKITHKVIVERLDGDNNNKLLNLEVYVQYLNTYLSFEEGMFDANKNLYTINIPYDETFRTVNVVATLPKDSKALITGDGIHTLNEINGVLFAEIKVGVTSEVGVLNTYTIQIIKGSAGAPGDMPVPESDDTTVKDVFIIKGPNNEYNYLMNENSKDNPLLVNSNESYLRIINAASDNKARLSNDLFDNLKAGLNELKFSVIAENGIFEEYIIYVSKAELSNDNTLKSLTIRYNGINYYENTNNDVEDEINLTLPRDAKEIIITAIKNSENAKDPQISNYTLQTGKLNTITVTVIAENGDAKVYRININLRDTSAEIELDFELENKEKLTAEIEKDLANNTIYYNLGEVSYSESILNIITRNINSNFIQVTNAGLKQLNIGENEFIITATSEDLATIITHRVIVTRLDGDTDNKLENLLVRIPIINEVLVFLEGEFNKNVFKYTISLKNELLLNTVEVIATLADNSKATVSGAGIYPLNEINGVLFAQINIVVTSEVGKINTYVIQIVKGGANDSNPAPEPESDDASIKDVFTIKGPNMEYNYLMNENSKDNPLLINSNESYLRIINAASDNKARLSNDLFDNLKAGLNELKFSVIAENGLSEDYLVYVFKDELSDDNTLKSLIVRFNGKNYYEKTNNDVEDEINITLPREALEINITAIKNNVKARDPQISDYKLETGKLNTVTITVIAENGDVKVYRININLRDTSAEILLDFELENKTKLDAIKDIDLENKTIFYDLGEVAYSEKILNIIKNTGTNNFIQVIGDGLKQLIIGENTFIVTATSEDLATTITHVITITRLEGDRNNLLTDLRVLDNGEVIPFDGIDFDPLTNNYLIRLPISLKLESVIISASVDALSKATIKGTGRLDLNNKDGLIFEQARIVVTSEIGVENIYTIEIIKATTAGSDDDNTVNEIYIIGLETNKKYPYIIGNEEPIIIDKADEFIEIKVITNSSKAVVSGTLIYKLVANQLLNAKITVKSENLELSTDYYIPIIKHALNDDAVISEIIIDGKLVEVNDGEFKIKHLIDASITKVPIDIKLPDGAKINYELPYIIDFNESVKEINFAVTSEDGLTTNIYTLELRKDNYEVKMASILIDDVEEINNFQDLILNLGNKAYKNAYFTIHAAAIDLDAKVVIAVNGKTLTGIMELTFDVSLSVGENIIEIYAESEFGKSDSYIIIVELDAPSDNNLLADLIVSDPFNENIFNINFAPNTNRYTVLIRDLNNLPSIKIAAIKGELNQVIEGDGIHNLSFNGNSGLISETFKIKVIAESGLVNTYEVVITRNLEPETDISVNRLSLIGNDGINYLGTELSAINQFISGSYEYNLVIPYAVEKLILTVVNNNGAEVSFVSGNGTYTLIDINNLVIEFYLTSKDSTKNNMDNPYVITITKEVPSDDNSLEFIMINNELIKDFNPSKTHYELVVDADLIKNINIEAKTNSLYANLSGTGIKQIFAHSDNFFTIRVTAENGDIKDYIINVKSQSNDNTINDIKVLGYNISPSFNEGVYTYTLDVLYSVNAIEIIVDASSSAKITNNGIVRLVEGLNNIEVYATSESGIRGKIYTLKVNRLPISSDNSLKSLIVKDAISGIELSYQPIFNGDILGYVIVLDKLSPTISINIEAEANNKYATVGGLGFHNLENKLENTEFGNIFNITVRAENGDTKTYQLKVYKGVSNLDSDTRINELSLIGSNNEIYLGTNEKALFKFNSNTFEYAIKVPFDVTTLNLSIVTASNQANVYYLSNSIQTFNGLEELVFEFYVQAATGITTSLYVISVKRAEPLSDNTLENIKIDNEFIEDFDPQTKEYEVYIPYGSTNHKLNLMPIVESGNKVSLQGEFGEISLKKGKNIFPIIVTSEDGKQNTYTVVVYHYNNNAKLEELIITGDGKNPTIYQINFDPEIFEYNIVISRQEEALMISARAQDKESGIYGATKRLLNKNSNGESFEVTIVAEDGITTNIYRINTSYNQELSNNKKINVSFSNIPFEMFNGQLSYHLPLKERLDSTLIYVTSEYEGTKIDINVNGRVVNNNQINLADNNNLITLKVTAEDGSVEFYTINIEKEPVQDVTFIILLILTFVLWFITIIVIIIKKNKQKDPVFTDVIY